jgi:ribosomal protein S18 acetylase RimI-like enzyme
MSVRSFVPESVSDFDQLYQSVFPNISNRNGVFGSDTKWYGLYDDQQLIAFASVGIHSHEQVFLFNVGVHPAYRKQGYGAQLMTKLIKILPMYGYKRVVLFVAKNNKWALHLYHKFGFTLAKRAFVPPLGEVCMIREFK